MIALPITPEGLPSVGRRIYWDLRTTARWVAFRSVDIIERLDSEPEFFGSLEQAAHAVSSDPLTEIKAAMIGGADLDPWALHVGEIMPRRVGVELWPFADFSVEAFGANCGGVLIGGELVCRGLQFRADKVRRAFPVGETIKRRGYRNAVRELRILADVALSGAAEPPKACEWIPEAATVYEISGRQARAAWEEVSTTAGYEFLASNLGKRKAARA